MVYSDEAQVKSLLDGPIIESEIPTINLRPGLLTKLGLFSQLYGQMNWGEGALEYLNDWHMKGGPPAPTHTKLSHYVRSRTLHVIKLALTSAVSRTGHLLVELADVKRAMAWMLDAERVMPDVFRAMTGKSDKQVLEELHLFMHAMYARNKHKPVDGAIMRQFLLDRLPHDKVESMVMASERANIIARVAGSQDSWIPRPRYEHGFES